MKGNSARDRALNKLITGKLGARLRRDGRGCPEAETLAAYAERTLTAREREACDLHLAACARCQEAVAALARLSEAEAPVEAPALSVPARRLPWFRWALAAPALIALVVAGLWYAGEFRPLLRQEQRAALPSPPPPSRDRLSPAETPTTPATAEGEAKSLEAEAAARKKAARAATPAAAAPEPLAAELRPAPAGAAGAGAPSETLAGVGTGSIATPGARARLAADQWRPLPAKELVAEAAKESVAARAAAPPPATTEVPPEAAVLGKAAEAKPKAETDLARRELALAESATGGTAAFSVRGIAPRRVSARWRVGAKGLIEKKDTEGQWMTQSSRVTTNLLDIAFPSDSVAWAVGEGGTVLRTADGGDSWHRVSIPTSEDLIQVEATSALAARVVTRSGKVFTTTDGGKAWKVARQE